MQPHKSFEPILVSTYAIKLGYAFIMRSRRDNYIYPWTFFQPSAFTRHHVLKACIKNLCKMFWILKKQAGTICSSNKPDNQMILHSFLGGFRALVVVTSTTQHKGMPKCDCVGAYRNWVKTFMKLHSKSYQLTPAQRAENNNYYLMNSQNRILFDGF